MQQYSINKGEVVRMGRKVQVKILFFMILIVAAAVVISTTNSKDAASASTGMYIFVPIIIAVLAYSFFRTKNRNRYILETYRLTITNNLITREIEGFPEISIYFNEVTEIIKRKNGSFTIKGKTKGDLIGVPSEIENYTELEKRLNEIKTITQNVRGSFLERFPYVLIVSVIASMACVYTLKNKIIVTIIGVIFSAFVLWAFIEVRKNKNVPDNVKRSMWWLLIVLFSVIGAVVTSLWD
jgi:hypothetical protein